MHTSAIGFIIEDRGIGSFNVDDGALLGFGVGRVLCQSALTTLISGGSSLYQTET